MKQEDAGLSEKLVAVLRGPDGRIKDVRIATNNRAGLLRKIIRKLRERQKGDEA